MARKKTAKAAVTGTAQTNASSKTLQSFAISAPGALNVQLVGDFTHWERQPINLTKHADGVWRTGIELAPGTHHYRFLVDGVWTDDPDCTLRVPNPFGSMNSVRKVG